MMTRLKTLFQPLALALAAVFVSAPAQAGTAHDFMFESIEGDPLPMNAYAGKAVLVVNTASRCGFTGQYDGLQALYDEFRDRGLVVLGVPSDDFRQELDSAEAVKEFCEVNFSIDFPMTDITSVKGDGAHPFYKWAAAQLGAPRWNFYKYLVTPDGRLVNSWSSMTGPESGKIRTAIEAVLPPQG